jgi:hypothetical protein
MPHPAMTDHRTTNCAMTNCAMMRCAMMNCAMMRCSNSKRPRQFYFVVHNMGMQAAAPSTNRLDAPNDS